MSEPTLRHVAIAICSACLDGAGGECHTPGCALWLHRTDTLRVHPGMYAEMPFVKPLPDAPGWWFVLYSGHTYAVPIEVRESHGTLCIRGVPVNDWSPGSWYGPIDLPWDRPA